MSYLFALFLFVIPFNATELRGRVVAIANGDTITVLDANNTQHKVRFNGIDAPESSQVFGQASKRNISTLIGGKIATIEYTKTDRYGRIIGTVILDGKTSTWSNSRQEWLGITALTNVTCHLTNVRLMPTQKRRHAKPGAVCELMPNHNRRGSFDILRRTRDHLYRPCPNVAATLLAIKTAGSIICPTAQIIARSASAIVCISIARVRR
jgi:hypothetical protein